MAATKRVVDLSDVKEGGNFRPRRKPEGDYKAKIVKVDDHQPNDKTKPIGWVYTIMIDGDARSTYPYYVNPEKKQAWKIGAICRATGLANVIGKRINFDPNKLVNKSIGVALADDEYEGRLKSSIDDVFPVSEVGANADEADPEPEDDEEIAGDYDEDEVEEEEEPAPPVRKRRVAKKAPEPEPEEDEEEEDEEEPPPPPRRRRKPAPEPEPEEDDEEEEDEPEPPKPTRRRAPAKTAAAPARRRKPTPPVDEDDDLDDLETDDLD